MHTLEMTFLYNTVCNICNLNLVYLGSICLYKNVILKTICILCLLNLMIMFLAMFNPCAYKKKNNVLKGWLFP